MPTIGGMSNHTLTLTGEPPATAIPANMRHIVSSETEQWFTPARYIEAARLVLGTIDIDPASCELANRTVKATRFFTAADDGLRQPWNGRVFLNPPYRRDGIQGKFVNKLILEFETGCCPEAILLVGNRTECDWFQPLYSYILCFTDHRIKFVSSTGKHDSPVNANVFAYLGPNGRRFCEVFQRFGAVLRQVAKPAEAPAAVNED